MSKSSTDTATRNSTGRTSSLLRNSVTGTASTTPTSIQGESSRHSDRTSSLNRRLVRKAFGFERRSSPRNRFSASIHKSKSSTPSSPSEAVFSNTSSERSLTHHSSSSLSHPGPSAPTALSTTTSSDDTERFVTANQTVNLSDIPASSRSSINQTESSTSSADTSSRTAVSRSIGTSQTSNTSIVLHFPPLINTVRETSTTGLSSHSSFPDSDDVTEGMHSSSLTGNDVTSDSRHPRAAKRNSSKSSVSLSSDHRSIKSRQIYIQSSSAGITSHSDAPDSDAIVFSSAARTYDTSTDVGSTSSGSFDRNRALFENHNSDHHHSDHSHEQRQSSSSVASEALRDGPTQTSNSESSVGISSHSDALDSDSIWSASTGRSYDTTTAVGSTSGGTFDRTRDRFENHNSGQGTDDPGHPHSSHSHEQSQSSSSASSGASRDRRIHTSNLESSGFVTNRVQAFKNLMSADLDSPNEATEASSATARETSNTHKINSRKTNHRTSHKPEAVMPVNTPVVSGHTRGARKINQLRIDRLFLEAQAIRLNGFPVLMVRIAQQPHLNRLVIRITIFLAILIIYLFTVRYLKGAGRCPEQLHLNFLGPLIPVV